MKQRPLTLKIYSAKIFYAAFYLFSLALVAHCLFRLRITIAAAKHNRIETMLLPIMLKILKFCLILFGLRTDVLSMRKQTRLASLFFIYLPAKYTTKFGQ